MKDFLKNNGLWILFAGAVIAVALALLSAFSNTSSPLANIVNVAASPFRAAYTAVADWYNDKQDYYEDVNALQAENEQLRKQLSEMEQTARQAESDREENALLRDLLELRAQRRDLSDFETARVLEHSVTNWTSSLTLNKGTLHGVETGDCVIDSTGNLVGLVDEVGLNWCYVLTVVDTDTSIGSKVFRTQDLGVAEGSLQTMEQQKLNLNYLPADAQILCGDLIVTSGLGGFLPPDLVIGSVAEVLTDESGTNSCAILNPAVDFDQLTEVCIIRSFDIVE